MSKNVVFISGPKERHEINWKGKVFYAELHSGSGWLFCDHNGDEFNPSKALQRFFFDNYPSMTSNP